MQKVFESPNQQKGPSAAKSNIPTSLEPAFFAQRLDTIKYAASLAEFHQSKYVELPAAVFEKKFNLRYTECPLIESTLRDATWQAFTSPKNYSDLADANALLEERFHNPLDCFVVVYIDEQVGHGLFLAHSAQKLPAGTILGAYSGHIMDQRSYVQSFLDDFQELIQYAAYGMSLGDEDLAACTTYQKYGDPSVNAHYVGNCFRFIQDGPKTSEMHKLNSLTVDQKSRIATENTYRWPIIFKGIPLMVEIAGRDILPGEQLLQSYDYVNIGNIDFWRVLGGRKLFGSTGEVIGVLRDNYSIEFTYLDPQRHLPVLQLAAQDLHKVRHVVQQLTNNQKPSFTTEKLFQKEINFLLGLFIKRFGDAGDSERERWLMDINTKFNQQTSSDAAYQILFTRLNKEACQPYLNPSVKILKNEIIRHMLAYKAAQNNSAAQTKSNDSLKISTDMKQQP